MAVYFFISEYDQTLNNHADWLNAILPRIYVTNNNRSADSLRAQMLYVHRKGHTTFVLGEFSRNGHTTFVSCKIRHEKNFFRT